MGEAIAGASVIGEACSLLAQFGAEVQKWWSKSTELTEEQKFARADRIPHHILTQAFAFLDQELAKDSEESGEDYPFKGVPVACGQADVYVPDHLPVVIKRTFNTVRSEERFSRSNYVYGNAGFPVRIANIREIRKFVMVQGLERLIIPRIAPDRRWVGLPKGEVLSPEYLIEEKLPIVSGDYTCIELYLQRHDAYDAAVRELVVLLSQYDLVDIVGNATGIQAVFAIQEFGVGISRFENLCPIVRDDGSIEFGLVDLEAVLPDKRDWHVFCRDLVTLFPLHFELIMDEVKKVCPGVELEDEYGAHVESLRKLSQNALRHYRHLYTDTIELLARRGVTVENPWTRFSMPPELKGEFIGLVVGEANEYLGSEKGKGLYEEQIPAVQKAIADENFVEKMLEVMIGNFNIHIARVEKASRVDSVTELIKCRSFFSGISELFPRGFYFHRGDGEESAEEKEINDQIGAINDFFQKEGVKSYFSYHTNLLDQDKIFRQFLQFCHDKGLIVLRFPAEDLPGASRKSYQFVV